MFAASWLPAPDVMADPNLSTDRAVLPGWWMAGVLGSSIALLAALNVDAGLWVNPFTLAASPILVWLAVTFGTAWKLRRARGRIGAALHEGALHFGVFAVLGLLGALATYPIASFTSGYVDDKLAAIDDALHFDWVAWYETVVAHPSLQILGRLAYQSIYLSPAILLGYFAWTRRTGEGRAMLATFWVAALITELLFIIMPAVGPFARDWHPPYPYMPDSALWQPILIDALRAHRMHVIDLGELRGLVSAPSFHTAAAVIYIAIAWRFARLRWPITLLNLAMLLSTPVEGTHYLSDMLIGGVVAVVSLVVIDALTGLRARQTRREASDLVPTTVIATHR